MYFLSYTFCSGPESWNPTGSKLRQHWRVRKTAIDGTMFWSRRKRTPAFSSPLHAQNITPLPPRPQHSPQRHRAGQSQIHLHSNPRPHLGPPTGPFSPGFASVIVMKGNGPEKGRKETFLFFLSHNVDSHRSKLPGAVWGVRRTNTCPVCVSAAGWRQK